MGCEPLMNYQINVNGFNQSIQQLFFIPFFPLLTNNTEHFFLFISVANHEEKNTKMPAIPKNESVTSQHLHSKLFK